MIRLSRLAVISALVLSAAGFASAQQAADPEAAPRDAIVGTTEIDFATRRPENKGKEGVVDTYKIDHVVNGNRRFRGEIFRSPQIKNLGGWGYAKQAAGYDYRVIVEAKVQNNWVPVGGLNGLMPFDPSSGAFKLNGAEEGRKLQLYVDRGRQTHKSPFEGQFYGKGSEPITVVLKRTVGARTVERSMQVDPMRFSQTVFAAGPEPDRYPTTKVNGDFNYEPQSYSYFPYNLKFSYTQSNVAKEDVLTGSMKWIKDPGYDSNGKSRYDLNIRANEATAKITPESEAFAEGLSDEDAFFAVQPGVPTWGGTIEYEDQFASGVDAPIASKITINVTAEGGVTKTQNMNLYKLLLLGTGPINDE